MTGCTELVGITVFRIDFAGEGLAKLVLSDKVSSVFWDGEWIVVVT